MLCDDDSEFVPNTPDDFHDLKDLFRISCEFEPNSQYMLMFNVELNHKQLLLANALLDHVEKDSSPEGVQDQARAVLQAAMALRGLTGQRPSPPTEQARQWNAQTAVGDVVQVWLNGRNGDSFLSRTESPAIDTPCGPVVLIRDHHKAVSLFDVRAVSCSSQEV